MVMVEDSRRESKQWWNSSAAYIFLKLYFKQRVRLVSIIAVFFKSIPTWHDIISPQYKNKI